jgi:mannose-6-phosphate isomerase-like protein (cupin superfamily)
MEKQMSSPAKQIFPTIVSRFGYSPLGPALWNTDAANVLQFRDLSLAQASGDALLGRHLCTGGLAISAEGLIEPDCAFAFLFVLAGRVTLRSAGQSPVIMGSLDAATRFGTGASTSIDFSHDAELIEMKATPAGAPQLESGAGTWTFSREAEGDYKQGDGPRAYFRYRDLGVAAATARRIHIHIVRSTKALDGGTGWHSHSMGQLFYVLRGWADLTVESQPGVRMSTGDAMCISSRMKHNVPAFSADYLVLEMCIPADYDTVDAPTAV